MPFAEPANESSGGTPSELSVSHAAVDRTGPVYKCRHCGLPIAVQWSVALSVRSEGQGAPCHICNWTGLTPATSVLAWTLAPARRVEELAGDFAQLGAADAQRRAHSCLERVTLALMVRADQVAAQRRDGRRSHGGRAEAEALEGW